MSLIFHDGTVDHFHYDYRHVSIALQMYSRKFFFLDVFCHERFFSSTVFTSYLLATVTIYLTDVFLIISLGGSSWWMIWSIPHFKSCWFFFSVSRKKTSSIEKHLPCPCQQKKILVAVEFSWHHGGYTVQGFEKPWILFDCFHLTKAIAVVLIFIFLTEMVSSQHNTSLFRCLEYSAFSKKMHIVDQP